MMKNVTILTYEEVEEIKSDLNEMIDSAKNGMRGTEDGQIICACLFEELIKLRTQFD